jgi:hypothetical protein
MVLGEKRFRIFTCRNATDLSTAAGGKGRSPGQSGQAVEPFVIEDRDVEGAIGEPFQLLREEAYVVLLILCGAVFGPCGEQRMEGALQNGALGSAVAFRAADFLVEDLKQPQEQLFLRLFGVRIEGDMHNIVGHRLLWHIRGLMAIPP